MCNAGPAVNLRLVNKKNRWGERLARCPLLWVTIVKPGRGDNKNKLKMHEQIVLRRSLKKKKNNFFSSFAIFPLEKKRITGDLKANTLDNKWWKHLNVIRLFEMSWLPGVRENKNYDPTFLPPRWVPPSLLAFAVRLCFENPFCRPWMRKKGSRRVLNSYPMRGRPP